MSRVGWPPKLNNKKRPRFCLGRFFYGKQEGEEGKKHVGAIISLNGTHRWRAGHASGVLQVGYDDKAVALEKTGPGRMPA